MGSTTVATDSTDKGGPRRVAAEVAAEVRRRKVREQAKVRLLTSAATMLAWLAQGQGLPRPPVILEHPRNQIVLAGGTVRLSVTILVGILETRYQWYRGALAVPGATNDVLTLGDVQRSPTADHEEYWVEVANGAGKRNSQRASVVVADIGPAQSASLGAQVTFQVPQGAGDFRFDTFQWRFNGVDIPGAVSSALVLTNVQARHDGEYAVEVTSAGAVGLLSAHLDIDPTFTKITTGPVVTDGANNRAGGWADINGDGYLDLLTPAVYGLTSASNSFAAPLVYLNHRDATFTRATTNEAGSVAAAGGDSIGGAWGDFNNDGFLDLYLPKAMDATGDVLFQNDGQGKFTGAPLGLPIDGGVCVWADYDNDGWLDVVTGGGLYHNLNGGSFAAVSLVPLMNTGRLAWADYDNDGRVDLWLGNQADNGGVHLWRNLGGGGFLELTDTPLAQLRGSFGGGDWGDYDNDGDLDLFVVQAGGPSQAAPNYLFRNDDGAFTRVLGQPIAEDSAQSIAAAWGDYDNDGFLDLYIGNLRFDGTSFSGSDPNLLGKTNFLYHNNGDGTFSKVLTGSPVNDVGTTFGASWADYNNDGFLDLFVVNGLKENDCLYQNNGNSNAWSVVNLRGATGPAGRLSNSYGLGAKVRTLATYRGQARWQLRQIMGGNGERSGPPLVAYFGLGDAKVIDTLRIEWPSGIVQELTNVGTNQILTITEAGLGIFPYKQELAVGTNTTFQAVTTFPEPLEYQWQHAGTNLLGETNVALTLSATPATAGELAGNYTVVIRSGATESISAPVIATSPAPPTITRQPESQVALVGRDVGFAVATAPSSTPLRYQWQHEGTTLPSAVSARLVLYNAQPAQAGSYSVVITNAAGAVTSVVAQLTLVQDQSVSASLGGDATLKLQTYGPVLEGLQWRRDGTDLPGATNLAWNLPNLSTNEVGTYSVVLNAAGAAPFTLTLLPDFIDTQFTRIREGPLVQEPNHYFWPHWLDYDNDGWEDVLIPLARASGYPVASRLYHNNRDGTFSNAENVLATATGAHSRAAIGDYDNDGDLDVFLPSEQNLSTLIRNDGEGRFTKITGDPWEEQLLQANASVWGDFNADGLLDLFVGNTFAASPPGTPANDWLFQNLGQGAFKKLTASEAGPVLETGARTAYAGWVDLDNDGQQELYTTKWLPAGPNREFKTAFFHRDAAGRWRPLTLPAGIPSWPFQATLAWGDFNNDGWLDAFAATWTNASQGLYLNLQGGGFANVAQSARLNSWPGSWAGAWGDYDNDGWLDLYVPGYQGTPVGYASLWHNQRDGTFSRVPTGSLANDTGPARGCAWADYDNNGFLDLLVTYTDGVAALTNCLYRNNGNANSWLKVRLAGTRSNRSALGAMVRVQATVWGQPLWQMRDLANRQGAEGSGPGFVAHFGLGDATNVNIVRIEWPSGIIQELANVATNQFLTVTEEGLGILPYRQELSLTTNTTFKAAASFPGPLEYQWQHAGTNLVGETNVTLTLSATPATAGELAGNYTVVIRSGATESISAPVIATSPALPTITRQPISQIAAVGSDVTFTVETAPSSTPLGYQWQRAGKDLAGATSAQLVLPQVKTWQHSDYVVVITNLAGAVTSVVAQLTLVQDQSVSASLGGDATLKLTTYGPALDSIQWRRDGVDILGATGATWALGSVSTNDLGTYSVTVSRPGASLEVTLPPNFIDPTFTKITAGPLVTDPGNSLAAAWEDYDQDGYPDLLVLRQPDAPNAWYRNRPGGTFTSLTNLPPPTPDSWIAGGWADFDNDGQLDLFVSRDYKPAFLYLNNGDGTYTPSEFPSTVPSSVSVADYNHDGLMDLYLCVRDLGQLNSLYRNNGNGSFTRMTRAEVGGLVNISPVGGAAWADYDDDGWVDVYVAKAHLSSTMSPISHGSRVVMFRSDATGHFVQAANAMTQATGPVLMGAWGDYDNDGRLDLAAVQFGETNQVYRNLGNGQFVRADLGLSIVGEYTSASWADYDNDGFLDLLLTGGGGLGNALYRNLGDGTFARITTGSLVTDRAVGGAGLAGLWWDYDNNGFLDLFVLNRAIAPGASSTRNFLYRNNGNSNAWLKVKLVGTLSNRMGVGTKVRAQAKFAGQPRWQRRDIQAGEAVNGNLYAHFGLGDATNVDIVRIEWPSGIVQELANVATNQFLTVTEEGVGILPHKQELSLTTNTTFKAVASFPGPLEYQWQHAGTNLVGETNVTLTLTALPATAGDRAGNYTVVIRSGATESISAPVIATSPALPTITKQPETQIALVGSDVTFTVETAPSSTPLGYQWRRSGALLAGATSPELVLTNVTLGRFGDYTVAITNAAGAVTSVVASLTVVQDQSRSASLGGEATLSLGQQGPLASLQWQFNGEHIPGATNPTWTLPNVQLTNIGLYSVVLSHAGASLTLTLPPNIVDPAFTKITTGPVVQDSGHFRNGAWGDYDGDGFVDLFVATGSLTGGVPNHFYRNSGDGTFSRIATGNIANDLARSWSAAWGDYDNDGWLDLYSGNSGNRNFLYRNNGDLTFTRVTNGVHVTDAMFTRGVAWGDYNNDGWLDLFACDGRPTEAANTLYRNLGGGTFTRATGAFSMEDLADTSAAAWADYDNDGFLDLIAVGASKLLYRNRGDGTLTRVLEGEVIKSTGQSYSAVWGDYDNDGWFDLLVAHLNRPNRLYHNNHDGTFTDLTQTDRFLGPAAGTAAWADFDNDGCLDLFMTGSPEGGQRTGLLYYGRGDGAFTPVATGSLVCDSPAPSAYLSGCAVADYDNDGFPDLFVAREDRNYLYRNNGNSNAWLKVALKATGSNRAAIGTKVRVRARIRDQAVWQLRQVSGGGRAQEDPRPNFGLGDAAQAEVVRVEWPSGIVQELTNVAPNQCLTVTEPPRLWMARPGELRIGCWQGQQAELEVSEDLVRWASLGTLTNLTGTLTYIDPAAGGQAARFYRARMP